MLGSGKLASLTGSVILLEFWGNARIIGELGGFKLNALKETCPCYGAQVSSTVTLS